MSSKKRLLLISALSLTALSTVTCSAAAVTAYAYQNRVLPRTIVAGLSVGSLTHQQATQLLLQKETELSNATLQVTYQDQTASIPLVELGVSVAGPDQNVTRTQNDIWDWIRPTHWQQFFSHKEVAIRYDFDQAVAQKKVESTFNVTTTAKDAVVVVENNSLVVQPAASGESIGISGIASAIELLLTKGLPQPVTVAVEPVAPQIYTETATQTKTEIEAALRPIYLVADGRGYSIPKEHLYDLIKYEPKNGALSWQIDDEKLQAYLSTKITGRINVKMVQKLIQSDTLEVTQQGRDGKVVDVTTLVSSVRRTIAEQTDTKQQPLLIPVQTVTFTEKVIPPEYIAGLFPGLYIDINLTKQKMFVMNGQTKTVQFLISSGKRGTATPVGLFYVKNKIDLAQSRLYPGIWMRNWNALAKNPDGSGYEGYGIHDLPAFNAAYTIVEGASHLGRPVSHGCVRLGHNESVWFYQNVPVGTPVNIHY
jgi:lipoprotein-anchoring transpeptidase ErfK/SrfK